jgi:hypothetical protein
MALGHWQKTSITVCGCHSAYHLAGVGMLSRVPHASDELLEHTATGWPLPAFRSRGTGDGD